MLNNDILVEYTRNYDLSDIHIRSNEPIALRINGNIEIIKDDFVSESDINEFIEVVLDKKNFEAFQQTRDADFAIMHDGVRFRANLYDTMNGPAMVLRKIDSAPPTPEKLGLPPILSKITQEKNGLVLVTGPTGSGKSTTLAALINKINETRSENIITVEDPIEYVHPSKRSIISQREVGRDTQTFSSALRAALREDPDVILVGELRDLETISLALTAAETGHLVFSTLHTNSAPSTINRILDVFPPEQQAQARSQLSQSLKLVVTQQLIKRVDKPGRVGAFEILINNHAVSNLIRENKIFQVQQTMQTNKSQGMILMEDSLSMLTAKGIIANNNLNKS